MSKPRVLNNLMTSKGGKYSRNPAKHRFGGGDGLVGMPQVSALSAEPGRYHLHVALACPWACGTYSMLKLKGLQDAISVSIVHPTWQRTKPDDPDDDHCGWVYRRPGDPPLTNTLGHGSFPCDEALVPDGATECASIREVYNLCGDTEGPFTTPVLWDKKEKKIISNESMDILYILNHSFNGIAKHPDRTLYLPEGSELESELELLNKTLIYPKVNNGVYRCGFARSQAAYDEAVGELFAALGELNDILGSRRFLAGDNFTWLDLRLFHTLVRFDPVYVVYFKTNERRLEDFPHLLAFVRDVFSIDEVGSSINMAHIKMHYFTSHPHLNTFGIIPVSNGPDLNQSHGRGELSSDSGVFARM